MTDPDPRLVRRLKTAGLLLGLGLLVEAASLLWSHPTSFLLFLLVGALLVAWGVVLYLLSVATFPSAPPSS